VLFQSDGAMGYKKEEGVGRVLALLKNIGVALNHDLKSQTRPHFRELFVTVVMKDD